MALGPAIALIGTAIAIAQTGSGVKLAESTLRKSATNSPQPAYPSGSLRRGATGVAVAAIFITADGRVRQVNILQAPDDDIRRTLVTTLSTWTFSPVQLQSTRSAVPAFGRLVFYYRTTKTGGEILTPSEAASKAGFKPTRTRSSEQQEISSAELTTKYRNVLVVDIREREEFSASHREGAINIPVDELDSRAPVEVPTGRPVAVDCSVDTSRTCRQAAHRLRSLGFPSVLVIY
jgi:rhodanese-related sulfurtransferase